MFYSWGDASASSGRTGRVKRQGHNNHNSAPSTTSNERVVTDRSKAHTPNAPSERVELSHTTAVHIPDKRKEEELLDETKSIADELYMEYIVPHTKYHCLVRIRAEAIGCLKAQQDAESSSRYVEKMKKSTEAKSKDLKKAQDRKVKDEIAWYESTKRLRKAHQEVVEQRERGFGAGGNGRGKSEDDDIDALSVRVFLALTKSSIFDSIEVLSILNHAVGALEKLAATYSHEDISELKNETEKLIKEHRRLQRQDQSNGKQDIHRLEQHHSEVEKLNQRAKTIRHQELKDSRRRIERYNFIAVLDRQMTELEDLEKSLPENKIDLFP
ncbi:hypothetical protein ACEPAI_10095 [Sanghuangporus weigelae]